MNAVRSPRMVPDVFYGEYQGIAGKGAEDAQATAGFDWIEPGEGQITVNKRPMDQYFPVISWMAFRMVMP